jgi:hypothetical protein
VLKVDKILKKEAALYELVPVPRNLSTDCGMCIKLENDLEGVKSRIEGIRMDKCFLFNGKEYIDIS